MISFTMFLHRSDYRYMAWGDASNANCGLFNLSTTLAVS